MFSCLFFVGFLLLVLSVNANYEGHQAISHFKYGDCQALNIFFERIDLLLISEVTDGSFEFTFSKVHKYIEDVDPAVSYLVVVKVNNGFDEIACILFDPVHWEGAN